MIQINFCKTVRPMLSDHFLSVLSMMLGVLWSNSWIRIPLGMAVDFGPGLTVLDGDLNPTKRGAVPIFGPCVL